MTGNDIEINRGSEGAQPARAASGWSYRPRIDVTEDADEFTIYADLPGAAADDVALDFENRTLTIRAPVKPRQPREIEFEAQEYGIGDFDREIVLSDAVDTGRISATCEHGVLTIHLPKTEEAKPRRIPVRAG